jgi:hypothetical protein
MSLKIICSGYCVRYPLGGLSWHHLQYLIGFQRLGHNVIFFEDYGWSNSCFDPALDVMSADPGYGINYMQRLLEPYGLQNRWCYLAENGDAHGLTRKQLARECREADVYFNLSNINWIPELEECRRRVLIDTDPVFTQIGAHGMGGSLSRYDALFTYGENVHESDCAMPTAGARWLATRQPIVLDLWPVKKADPGAPFTTIMNWSPLGDCVHEGRVYGQKEREFEPFFSLPRDTGASMQVAVKVPTDVRQRFVAGGWTIADPIRITRSPFSYQSYLRSSKAEFSVAKHGYVTTRCGWFSERSAAYLASGRPVVVQDTGFSRRLKADDGLIPFNSREEAVAGVEKVKQRYAAHCRAAREVAEQYFDARKVLTSLLDRSFDRRLPPAAVAQQAGHDSEGAIPQRSS